MTAWNEDYHLCRMIGHTWLPQARSRHGWKPSWGIGIVLECERCGSERHDTIDQNGELSTRSYVYAEGYAGEVNADGNRPSRMELRATWVRRKRLKSRGDRPDKSETPGAAEAPNKTKRKK